MLEMEFEQSRMVYKCPLGHHDDLAMSCAMLVWAAQHPHLRVVVPRFGAASPSQQTTGAQCGSLDVAVV